MDVHSSLPAGFLGNREVVLKKVLHPLIIFYHGSWTSNCSGATAMKTGTNFLHEQLDLRPEDVVEVSLNSQANVMLLDPQNFLKYEHKKDYRYYGGHAEKTPVRLSAPHAGRWHLVVDLGGYAGSVRADIRLFRDGTVVQ